MRVSQKNLPTLFDIYPSCGRVFITDNPRGLPEMTTLDVVSQNLGTLMREQNKNLKELSGVLGVTEDQASELADSGDLDFNQIPILCEWFNIEPEDLLVRRT